MDKGRTPCPTLPSPTKK